MMKKQSLSEMVKDWAFGRHQSAAYTCSIRDWLCKATLQEHSKINKNQIKIFAWKDNLFPLSDLQYPLKNKQWHSSKPLTFPKWNHIV